VQQRLLDARDRGCAILLVSQDLNELRTLADRLLVMRDGKLVAELDPRIADPQEIGAVMTGATQ
jgi:simple sugar transport system ATP-binding protein